VGVAEPLHSERIWRLPQVTVTYQGIENLPPVRERPPFEDSGYITFGCLNRLTKVSDATLETWARILNAVPDARLFMVVGGIGTAEVREAVENRLKVAGMDVDRVIFHPRVETGYHALFHNVDIALDPYPYNGGTTSIDTLSMGVPFVALNGQQAAARTGASILRVVGLSELVAEDQDSYVTIARDLATDRDRLRAIRNGMRERLMSSPLMDHAALAADVGSAFQAMWRTWLEEGDGATDRRA
jgi:predicted O-linked N-acetylglucosamine transferase (SPINDLY family)